MALAGRALLLALVAACASTASSQGPTFPFRLPTLDYTYSALEPFIDNMTMFLHYARHHNGSVNALNAALAPYPALQRLTVYQLLASLNTSIPANITTAVRNNAGSHFNHALFWKTMAPFAVANRTQPSAKLRNKIRAAFGTTENMTALLVAAGNQRFGSGWAWVGVNTRRFNQLTIFSIPNQDVSLMPGSLLGDTILSLMPGSLVGEAISDLIPILGVDVWEHAYYLKHYNLKANYLALWRQLINWDVVNEIFEQATQGRFNEAMWA